MWRFSFVFLLSRCCRCCAVGLHSSRTEVIWTLQKRHDGVVWLFFLLIFDVSPKPYLMNFQVVLFISVWLLFVVNPTAISKEVEKHQKKGPLWGKKTHGSKDSLRSREETDMFRKRTHFHKSSSFSSGCTEKLLRTLSLLSLLPSEGRSGRFRMRLYDLEDVKPNAFPPKPQALLMPHASRTAIRWFTQQCLSWQEVIGTSPPLFPLSTTSTQLQ